MPWIRHLFIVTNGERPFWSDYPEAKWVKAKWVTHKDIFLDRRHLPTYNSMAIECHLHRIPGLAEHFIYFNDDIMALRPAPRTYWFTPAGDAIVHTTKSHLGLRYVSPVPTRSAFTGPWAHARSLLLKEFNKPLDLKMRYLSHQPSACKKSLFVSAVRKYAAWFNRTSSNHRRRANAIPPIGFVSYRGVFDNQSMLRVEKNTRYLRLDRSIAAVDKDLAGVLSNSSALILLCLNRKPHGSSENAVIRRINRFLRRHLVSMGFTGHLARK